ncbi:MAG: succinate dehydrogenase iron-sulfur subunit [Candidatus Latescibacteria bacterium]|nr:succinate dehydrogenase iron-sulfur subunit [Candidatus Latescibacterota bacterium]
MLVNMKVRRYDPESDAPPRYQAYSLDVPRYTTVLDALIQIREEIDGTLALRCSCRSAICGSCAMRINGRARLACKTKILTLAPHGEEVVVEPGGNLPVIKDLVVDMTPFWNKIKAVQPWLQPAGQPPEREYIVPNERMLDLAGVMDCIMCGACVMDCTVFDAELQMGKPTDTTFLGPAALAKAYRFVGDPRDSATNDRLRVLSEATGIWDCTHCFECVEVCPKHVAPMERILALRRAATEAGFTDNSGSRHSEAFADSVRQSGWLNEFTLIQKSIGFNIGELLRLLPGGMRMLFRGKTPSPIHRPLPQVESVRRIFDTFEKRPQQSREGSP